VAGPAGERAQALFSIIAGEASAATGDARHAVLKRFGDASDVEFFLFGIDETQLAGNKVELPADVRERMEFRGPGWGFAGGPPPPGFVPKGFGPRGESRRPGEFETDAERRREPSAEGSPAAVDKRPREHRETRDPADRGRFGMEPPGRGENFPTVLFAGRPVTRFIVRTNAPTAYWVGMRVPFTSSERGNRFMPAKMVARVGSLWGLLNLLGLHSWLLAGSAVLLLSVLFWLPLVHSITRSLGQLTTATEKIAEGHFDTRVDARRRDELGKLGESVNRMATRLDAHMSGQKRFLGDVAHELCSPLARLQMATGILADQSPASLQETVSDVREEVQQMSTLVNELLAFTKAGMQPRQVELTAIALEPLARDVLAREGAGDRVTLAIAPELRVLAESELLGRALGNLVRNAVRYAGEAGPITVTAAAAGGRVAILVEDSGPGVPPADVDRLGEPFFRPELARTREGGGVGLGLAIVRNSIAACGGEVRFSNRAPQGFRAELRLAAA
jgi:two-component system sensor histidine kinase CpxA